MLMVKSLSANARDVEVQVPSLGWEDPLEEGMDTHSSFLAWRIPWTEEPGGLQYKESPRVGHNWSDLAHTHVSLKGNKNIQSFREMEQANFFAYSEKNVASFSFFFFYQ